MGTLLFVLALILLFVFLSVRKTNKRKGEHEAALETILNEVREEADKEREAIIANLDAEKKKDIEEILDGVRKTRAENQGKKKTEESKK